MTPKAVNLIRGNHETSGCVARYGFEDEVMAKYDPEVFRSCLSLFRELPLAAVVSTKPFTTSSIEIGRAAGDGKRKTRSVSAVKQGLEPGERRVLILHGGIGRTWDTKHGQSTTIFNLEDIRKAKR